MGSSGYSRVRVRVLKKIQDPKRNYLTLFNKPLAELTITGWGGALRRGMPWGTVTLD